MQPGYGQPVPTGRSPILVVDDDEFVRGATVAVLEADGYEAIGARTATQALSLLRAGMVKPSLILLDFMMPGMTGGDFRAAQLRDAALASIPVVFVSAFPQTLDALQRGPLRAVAVLAKPVDARDLLALVGRLCHPPEPSTGDGKSSRRFVVSCLHCRRIIDIVGRIAEDELNRLRAHLGACCPSEVVDPPPGVEVTLRHFRIEPADPDDEPPPHAD